MLSEALLDKHKYGHTIKPSMYDMNNMNNAQCKRERELEKVDQTQTQRYVSRFEHPALRSRLHTKGFSLTHPHRTSHTGNLH